MCQNIIIREINKIIKRISEKQINKNIRDNQESIREYQYNIREYQMYLFRIISIFSSLEFYIKQAICKQKREHVSTIAKHVI